MLVEKIRRHYAGELAGRTFALWGLAFKPMTDDMREAASRVVMEALWAEGARVQAYDPEAMEEAQRLYGDREDLVLCGTKEAALKGADALVVVTEWQAFRAPDFDLIREKLKAPVIFDGRNLYEPARMARKGFAYYGIGRGLGEPKAAAAAPGLLGGLSLRVLVTGAAGFIGFFVARSLLARGDRVTGLDNLNDYYDPALKAARLAELDRMGGDWRFRRADLADARGGRGGLRRETGAVRPGDPPRRPGRGALQPREPARLRRGEPRGLHQPARGSPCGADPAPGLRLDLERLRRQRRACPSPRARRSATRCSSTPPPSGRTS